MVSLKNALLTICILFTALILALTLRGEPGNPTTSEFGSLDYINNNPMELSHERAYFALTYAMLENKTFQFSVPLARFSTPDVAYQNNVYISLFAPGVSFLIIPGYIIGKLFGLSQLGSFAIVAICSVLNGLLIYAIARLLDAKKSASLIGGLVYVFATPSFAYEVSLYQHQFTVLCMLLGTLLLLKYRSWYSASLVWLLLGVSFIIDSPNIFLLAPLGIYALLCAFKYSKNLREYFIHAEIKQILVVIFAVIPILFLIWYNVSAFGLPLSLSGSLPSVDSIDQAGNPVSLINIHGKMVNVFTSDGLLKDAPPVNAFFNPRNMLNGFYIEIMSNERGILYFTPVLFLSIFGFISLFRTKPTIASMLASLIGVNVILYTMWGDPWGGWAFGARYLIPAYSILAIVLAVTLSNFRTKKWFTVLFIVLAIYSISVNTLGALTTNKVPPKIQAEQMSAQYHQEFKYTYFANLDALNAGQTYSFAYNQFVAGVMPLWLYYLLIVSFISVMVIWLSFMTTTEDTI